MKNTLKATLLATVLGLASTTVLAKSIPGDIYKPRNAEVVKVDRQGRGEYEVEFRLYGDDVRPLAKRVIEHAKDRGFRIEESEIKRDDADLKFKRGDQELDVSIELKNKDRIEYKADLDLDKS
ncbi:hypothetical protein [Aggregatibacter actinomycetemcomitans]|uniref:hypothetical protein n=1 Tax=Aggregatibacter actinomycetemcomitans TaxID=714 RepID=UPI00197B2D3F|nr:hypothetical protein [Aggregatibacter actinomycetemcomitans]MBN6065867.1 hypothetical protein [Aggregatibacter actinomycetemcomitans]MBN6078928.1 hypothetical protein [Aggregatibacter actinomycetemcomitans]